MDDLIERLRTRVADPDRRLDSSTGTAGSAITLSLSDLFGQSEGLAASLTRVVDANRAGRPLEPDLRVRLEQLASAMAERRPPALPAPARPQRLDVAEAELGFVLPTALRRLYTEVADGGFGPAGGLLPLADVVATYHRFRVDPPMAPDGQSWPSGLLPVIRYDVGVDAVEAATGRVIGWDPDSLTERSGGPGWRRTFTELAPSVEAWLDAWARARTPSEMRAEHLKSYQVEQARASRAHIATLSPEERAAMGLPEVGWERVVWGGIGLDEDAAEDGTP